MELAGPTRQGLSRVGTTPAVAQHWRRRPCHPLVKTPPYAKPKPRDRLPFHQSPPTRRRCVPCRLHLLLFFHAGAHGQVARPRCLPTTVDLSSLLPRPSATAMCINASRPAAAVSISIPGTEAGPLQEPSPCAVLASPSPFHRRRRQAAASGAG